MQFDGDGTAGEAFGGELDGQFGWVGGGVMVGIRCGVFAGYAHVDCALAVRGVGDVEAGGCGCAVEGDQARDVDFDARTVTPGEVARIEEGGTELATLSDELDRRYIDRCESIAQWSR